MKRVWLMRLWFAHYVVGGLLAAAGLLAASDWLLKLAACVAVTERVLALVASEDDDAAPTAAK